MTVSQILTFVNEVRPNAYSNIVKTQFLNEIESEIFDFLIKFVPRPYEEINNTDAINMERVIEVPAPEEPEEPEEEETQGSTAVDDPLNLGKPRPPKPPIYSLKPYTAADTNATVLLPDRFMGVYTSYIMAKIDHLASESGDYQNDALMHQAEMEAFQEWYTRTHMPRHPRIGGLS